jgi:hypothetical protein
VITTATASSNREQQQPAAKNGKAKVDKFEKSQDLLLIANPTAAKF